MLCKYSNILYVVSWVQKETLWRVRLEIVKKNNFPHYAAGHPSHGVSALASHRVSGSGMSQVVRLRPASGCLAYSLSHGVRLWPVTGCSALACHRASGSGMSQAERLWPVTEYTDLACHMSGCTALACHRVSGSRVQMNLS